MSTYQAVSFVFLLLGNCFFGPQGNPQIQVCPMLQPEQQLLCPFTSYMINCTIQGNFLVWELLNGSDVVDGQTFSTGSSSTSIPTEEFLFTLDDVTNGIVSTVAFNSTKDMTVDTLVCTDTVNTMQEPTHTSIVVFVMIPAVVNATPSEIFDTADEVNCFNITWEEPPCAVGYNITTVYGGLTYSTVDQQITICGVLCRETIRIQPIDNGGDGGYTTLVNVTHPDVEPRVITVTETTKETVTETINKTVTKNITRTVHVSPSETCSPCPRFYVPWWSNLISIVATVIAMLLVIVIALIVMKVWKDCQSKTVCPDDQNVKLRTKQTAGSGQLDEPGYSKELEAADI